MADPVLEIERLSVRVGETTILSEVSISVRSGCFVSIIGPNGAGKSTLIRCLDGLLEPDQGSIRIDGRLLGRYSRRALARVVSYVPQSTVGAHQFDVATFVEMGRYPHLGPWAALGARDYEEVRKALDMTVNEQHVVMEQEELRVVHPQEGIHRVQESDGFLDVARFLIGQQQRLIRLHRVRRGT